MHTEARGCISSQTNSDVLTMKSTTLPMADTMGAYRSTSKGCRDKRLSVMGQLFIENLCEFFIVAQATILPSYGQGRPSL